MCVNMIQVHQKQIPYKHLKSKNGALKWFLMYWDLYCKSTINSMFLNILYYNGVLHSKIIKYI